MTFADKSFSVRKARMGEQAENAFMEWANKAGVKYLRIGLDDNPFAHTWDIPESVRRLPDFIAETPDGKRKIYVECKGTGGSVLKIKVDDLMYLQRHDAEMPVWFSVYDSKNKRLKLVSYDDMLTYSGESPIETFSNDGKEYYAIDTKHIWKKADEPKENDNA